MEKSEVERLREMEKMLRFEAIYNGSRPVREVYEIIRLNSSACSIPSETTPNSLRFHLQKHGIPYKRAK